MADKDSDDESDSPAPPHTPPRRQHRHQHGAEPPHHSYRPSDSTAASPTRLSPPASPSMSDYSFSLSPLSPLIPETHPDPLIPELGDGGDAADGDGRIELVQRLNNLAARLIQQQSYVQDGSIDFMHAKVDELEKALFTPDHSLARGTWRSGSPSLSPGGEKPESEHEPDGSDDSWEEKQPHPDSMLPSDVSSLASPARPAPPSTTTAVDRQASGKAKSQVLGMNKAQAEKVVTETQDLHKNLEVVISNLRDRQEETEHIHALLIARLERAAQRIIELEKQLHGLEIHGKESDTDLLNLRIQLKAIEVQCLSYVPEDADPELSESIDAWKMEWSALKQKRARNKGNVDKDTPTRGQPPPSSAE
ncbi:hypothetical protein F4808DRAFT_51322 [Astrocystis sublimbata]|nr:hypothetical protein F4808DRAFT_51322 [Astrocystis sublimbata]